jgi:hypothetical protein
MNPFDESPFDAADANPDSTGEPPSASRPPKASIAMATPKHIIDLGNHPSAAFTQRLIEQGHSHAEAAARLAIPNAPCVPGSTRTTPCRSVGH